MNRASLGQHGRMAPTGAAAAGGAYQPANRTVFTQAEVGTFERIKQWRNEHASVPDTCCRPKYLSERTMQQVESLILGRPDFQLDIRDAVDIGNWYNLAFEYSDHIKFNMKDREQVQLLAKIFEAIIMHENVRNDVKGALFGGALFHQRYLWFPIENKEDRMNIEKSFLTCLKHYYDTGGEKAKQDVHTFFSLGFASGYDSRNANSISLFVSLTNNGYTIKHLYSGKAKELVKRLNQDFDLKLDIPTNWMKIILIVESVAVVLLVVMLGFIWQLLNVVEERKRAAAVLVNA